MLLDILLFYLIFILISYLIFKFIYRILFKSQKKVSKFLVFLGSIGLIMFYYTPYSYYLEPTYWQFRNICKINELPNNEYKYNKILSYFDTDLESLDWEELNEKTWKVTEKHGHYKKGVFEYETVSKQKQLNNRISIIAGFLSNTSPINRYNTNQMSIGISWHTRRYFLGGNEGSGFYWYEEKLRCSNTDIIKNYTPKEISNE